MTNRKFKKGSWTCNREWNKSRSSNIKIGLGQYKDYGIISYLNKKDSEKIGEFILWALSESDNEEIEDEVNIKWCKKY